MLSMNMYQLPWMLVTVDKSRIKREQIFAVAKQKKVPVIYISYK